MLWDLFMLFLRILEVSGTLLVGAAASFGAWVAWKGWQRDMRGQTEYKLAVDLLKATYCFRDAIDLARSRLIFAHEMIIEDEDSTNSSDDMQKFKEMTRAYEERWKQAMQEQQTIYDNLQSAEVIWGEDVKNLFQDLFAHTIKLRWAIEEYLDSINPPLSEPPEKLSKETNAILHKPHREEDKFGDELQRLITEIDNYLKPKLNP